MPAKLTYVLGRAGSGKSRFLHDTARALCSDGRRVCVIVPEQFTFETERELSALMGDTVSLSVFSFTTLAKRVLSRAGERRRFLSRQGRRMAIRKAASELAQELTAFNAVCAEPGFAEKMDELISLCKRFEVTPAQLLNAADGVKKPQLAEKLHDLALIYDDVSAQLAGALDSDDALTLLAKNIPSSFLADAYVIIDGFDMLTEQIYSIVRELMVSCAEIYISLRKDDAARDAAVFISDSKAYSRFTAMARVTGCAVHTVHMPDASLPPARYVSPALEYLEHEAFAFPFSPCPIPGAPKGITLFAGRDRSGEANACADAVLKAARDGVRFRDMAVVAPDMEGYLSAISRAFSARGIPFFTDAKHPLSMYAAARLAVYALRAASVSFRHNDIVGLVRTGLTGVSDADGEQLENHMLRFGIQGARLASPFTQADCPMEAERARQALMPPLLRLKEALNAGRTAADKTAALYGYMEELSLYDTLYAGTRALEASGRLQLMEENAQVYNKLMELLSQLHAILGASELSTARYIEIFREGLSAYEIGAIPSTADQVLFGSVGRTRARSVKALCIVGAGEGLFPRACPDDDVINDAELSELRALGVSAWDGAADRGAVELANAYSALTKPSERLFISYPLRDGAEAVQPAAAVDRLLDIFPELAVETDITGDIEPVDAAGGFPVLNQKLNSFAQGKGADDALTGLYSYYAHAPEYQERLSLIESALYDSASPEPFGRDAATALYRNMESISATRLETFNSCPFRHFARYGLRLLPRAEYRERSLEEGQFCHEALSRFVNGCVADGALNTLTEADVYARLDALLPALVREHNGGILLATARSRARAQELSSRIKQTAWAIVRQLRNGGFSVLGTEVRFGRGGALPPVQVMSGGRRFCISGIIDRLDGAVLEGQSYYRIIDYKTGGRTFDFADLYNGLGMQLPLYIAAALAADSAARACGMYYLPVKDPVLDESVTEDAFVSELYKQFRLKGLTLNDAGIIELTQAGGAPEAISTGGNAGGFVSDEKLLHIKDFALRRAGGTLSAICEGRADARPAHDGRPACDICDYPSLCRFDPRQPGCAYRVIKPLSQAEFLRISGAAGGKEADES